MSLPLHKQSIVVGSEVYIAGGSEANFIGTVRKHLDSGLVRVAATCGAIEISYDVEPERLVLIDWMDPA